MIRAIRNVALLMIVLAVAASGQQATKADAPAKQASKPGAAPCSASPASASPTARPAPDLSEAAKKACDSKKGEYWDEQKGCMWVVDWDFGNEPIGIDPQSSAVQKNTADYEYERLPVERSIGGILSLP